MMVFLRYSPRVVVSKILLKIKKKINLYKDRIIDSRSNRLPSPAIRSMISINALDLSQLDSEVASYLVNKFTCHEFDLLGSGWIKNSYFSKSPGLEGFRYDNTFSFKIDSEGKWLETLLIKPNLKSAREIMSLVSDDYEPIDWQKDYKSGYRWSQSIGYSRQPIGHLPGVDVKVPWELSRMQHLVQLAVIAISLEEKRSEILKELRNQMLDFIATNPVRMGVNWVCTMDVAIRAANLLVAYDILKQLDTHGVFDDSFDRIFASSIYEHGTYIISNLEYSTILTTNHYLANIAGLLFIASYLESSLETDYWLMFASQEFINEFKKQFYSDGVNFEASTSYHCLSSELVTYSTALILGISDERKKKAASRNYSSYYFTYPFFKRDEEYNVVHGDFFSEWFSNRLYKCGQFIVDITKNTGEIAQIGDNDSGKFFRFMPQGQFLPHSEALRKYLNLAHFKLNESVDRYWDENNLIHQDIINAIFSLFENGNVVDKVKGFEASFILTLCNGRKLKKLQHNPMSLPKHEVIIPSELKRKKLIIPFTDSGQTVEGELNCSVYLESGYCIFRSTNLFLLITFGDVGQNGFGGHSHNDKLSFELSLGNVHYTLDPGSYLYTPLPKKRNLFRQTSVHNTLWAGIEQNEMDDRDLFKVANQSHCELLDITANSVTLSLRYKENHHYRKFSIYNDTLEIEDFSNTEFTTKLNNFEFYSNGYGKLMDKATAML